MPYTNIFVDGAEIRLDNGRSIITCLLDLCPDRKGGECWQNCPVMTASEVRQLIAQHPDALIGRFLSKELDNAGY